MDPLINTVLYYLLQQGLVEDRGNCRLRLHCQSARVQACSRLWAAPARSRTQGLRFATAPRAGQNAELVAISKIMCTSLHETPVPKRSQHFLG
jgi:hypothetical protein